MGDAQGAGTHCITQDTAAPRERLRVALDAYVTFYGTARPVRRAHEARLSGQMYSSVIDARRQNRAS